MFEIGSEFWTEKPDSGNGIKDHLPSHFETHFTLCGRTALDIIIEDLVQRKKIHSIYLPSYCCFTMIKPFIEHEIEVVFYDVVVLKNGIESIYKDNTCDVVFLIDYFGYINEQTLSFAKSEKQKGKTIIYDLTHSLFCDFDKESLFDYVFGSFKKWIGINAGFVSKKGSWKNFPKLKQNEVFTEKRNKAFDLKSRYISDPNTTDKNIFLEWFRESEELLENDYKYYCPDKRSIDKLSNIDVKKLRKKRIENASVLIEGLKESDGLQVPYVTIKSNECPLFVPICVDRHRDELRRYLINNNIYLPVHWPVSILHRLNTVTGALYDTEMSCVCDQRYDEEDMLRIIDKIIEFFKKN